MKDLFVVNQKEAKQGIQFSYADLAALLFGALICALIASCLLSGFPNGIFPDLSHPYVYGGDALLQYAMTKRAMEGWIFDSSRLGYPFGASWLDYPGSDSANWLVLKLLGYMTGTYYGAANIYFLIGFSVNFCSAFLVSRSVNIERSIALLIAFLFAFSPYGLAREFYGHTFYTWYFQIPLIFFAGRYVFDNRTSLRKSTSISLLLFSMASFGIYYSLFGMITILLCGTLGSMLHSRLSNLYLSGLFMASISLGVLSNLLPHLLFWLRNGANAQVASRAAAESEIYGLKLIHLLLPPPDYRISAIAEYSRYYAANFPLSNTVSYLGVFGVFGAAYAFYRLIGSSVLPRSNKIEGLVSSLLIISFAIATVGGFSVVFAVAVSPSIRGWDRFSIFIIFYSLLSFGFLLNPLAGMKNIYLKNCVLIAIGIIGFFDQTSYTSVYKSYSNEAQFRQDVSFILNIEMELQKGAAIYQLPYISFPETPPIYQMDSYQQLVPFINSRYMKFNAGGMRGREASEFYKKQAQSTIAEQVRLAKEMKFAGIYVDGKGFVDGGREVQGLIESLLQHAPDIVRKDGSAFFFKFRGSDGSGRFGS